VLSVVAASVGIAATIGGGIATIAKHVAAAKANEMQAEIKLEAAIVAMKTHFNKLEKARKKGGLAKISQVVDNEIHDYVLKCETAKEVHWMRCQTMIQSVAEVETRRRNLEKSLATLSKLLAENEKEVSSMPEGDAKQKKAKASVAKEIKNLRKQVPALEKSLQQARDLRVVIEQRLQAKVDLHKELEKTIKEIRAAKADPKLAGLDNLVTKAKGGMEHVKPFADALLAAGKSTITLGKNTMAVMKALKA